MLDERCCAPLSANLLSAPRPNNPEEEAYGNNRKAAFREHLVEGFFIFVIESMLLSLMACKQD